MTRLIHLARWGVLFNPRALWLGLHYSTHQRRACLNLVPCVTLWVTLRNGVAP